MKTITLMAWMLLAALASKGAPISSSAYYELRIYDVSSNKLDAVVERFRETVDPVRRKYSVETRGYWTTASTNGQKFIYLMAAPSLEELQKREKEFSADPEFKTGYAESSKKHGKTVENIRTIPLLPGPGSVFNGDPSSKDRVFDLRLYSVLPGKLEFFRNRWRDFAVPIYQRHGLQSIGWWISGNKDSQGNDIFVCLLAGSSETEIQKSINAFHQDAEWLKVEKESEKDGKLRSSVEAFKLKPVSFSLLK